MPAAKWIAPLCHQIWPTEETMPKVKVPTLMLSGMEDEIVPCVITLSASYRTTNT